MQYKALMCDVDGTLIPNKSGGMPSEKVKSAIAKASKYVHVGIATSRPFCDAEHIINDLALSGPSILTGGAEIYDATNKKILKEYPIPYQELEKILPLANQLHTNVLVNDGEKDVELGTVPTDHLLQFYMEALETDIADRFIQQVSAIAKLAIHKVPSWTIGKFDIVVTHPSATKQHGIFEVAKILNIQTHEIIGIGDGNNDFPLLMACGLKIAMENAVPELKAIADYIAPPVEEDGVAHIIEKYILASS